MLSRYQSTPIANISKGWWSWGTLYAGNFTYTF